MTLVLDIVWLLLAVCFFIYVVLVEFKMRKIFYDYLKLKEKQLENGLKEFKKHVESSEQPVDQKSNLEQQNPAGVEPSISEETLSSLVSKKTSTAVSFGEDVSE